LNGALARSLSPERAFILSGARLKANSESLKDAAFRVSRWDSVLEEGRSHHLTPMIARSLDEASLETPVSVSMREDWHRSRAVNALRLLEANEVLGALVRGGLSPVVLKGMAVLESVYMDIGLRAFCDIDVLVAPPELKRAEQIVRELSFQQEQSPHEQSWYLENYYQLPRFYRPHKALLVELHWDLGRRPYPFVLNLPAMIERSRPANVAGIGVRVFDAPDQLLHLIMHLSWGNGFDGHVRGLVDIAELIGLGIDWDVFVDRVLAANAAQITVPVLELSQWLLNAPVPPVVIQRLRPRSGGITTRFIVRSGQARVFSGGSGHRTLMRLAWLTRISDKATLLRENYSLDASIAQIVDGIRHAAGALLPWPRA
jgi:hypothetical protein